MALARHSIGDFWFDTWRGEVQQGSVVNQVIRRIGIGAGAREVGLQPPEFRIVTERFVRTRGAARVLFLNYNRMSRFPPQYIFVNGIRYPYPFKVLKVTRAQENAVGVVANSIEANPTAVLVATWLLIEMPLYKESDDD